MGIIFEWEMDLGMKFEEKHWKDQQWFGIMKSTANRAVVYQTEEILSFDVAYLGISIMNASYSQFGWLLKFHYQKDSQMGRGWKVKPTPGSHRNVGMYIQNGITSLFVRRLSSI